MEKRRQKKEGNKGTGTKKGSKKKESMKEI